MAQMPIASLRSAPLSTEKELRRRARRARRESAKGDYKSTRRWLRVTEEIAVSK